MSVVQGYLDVSSITLVGLSGSAYGSGSIELPRLQPSASLVPDQPQEWTEYADRFPTPPAHIQPRLNPETVHVQIQLTELLAHGGSSAVYAARAVNNDSSAAQLPPLAVKIARPTRRGHIAREAWFYDDLLPLQGSVIPRCYGWFDAPETDLFKCSTYAPDSVQDAHGKPSYYPKPWSPALDELAEPRNHVSVLVMELLGSYIPLDVKLPKSLKQDVLDLGHSMSAHYVYARDAIRHIHILHMLIDPHALPSLPSPVTGRVHEWRIIDLESCQRWPRSPENLAQWWDSWFSLLLRSLPKGWIPEPWHYPE